MKRILRPIAIVATAGLLMLAGCEEKHEPAKPTVAVHSGAGGAGTG